MLCQKKSTNCAYINYKKILKLLAVVVVAVGWSGSGNNWLVVAHGFSTLVVVVVRCFFGFAKGTKNNNIKLLLTTALAATGASS